MPEIPDIQVFCNNIKELYAGKKIASIKVVNGKKLADTQKDLSESLEGKTLKDVYRSGKELRFKFSNGQIMGIHLMLTGDIIPFDKTNTKKATIAELHFTDGQGLALADRFGNALIKLNPVDKKGIDALDEGLDYKYLKSIFEKRRAQVKSILIDQNIIRGIGFSYSDEILWQCRISPFSIAKAIPDEKIKELAKTIKSVLRKRSYAYQKRILASYMAKRKSSYRYIQSYIQKALQELPLKPYKKGCLKRIIQMNKSCINDFSLCGCLNFDR